MPRGVRGSGKGKSPPTTRKVTVKEHKRSCVFKNVATLNRQQEKFAHEYLVDMDASKAYVRAGYEVKDEKVAASAGGRLLRHVLVAELIERLQREAMQKTDINRDTTILRFKMVYLSAMASRDWGNACRALENIGRFLGLYEKDNQQRKYGQEDVEKLRAELERAGFNFEIAAYKTPSQITTDRRVEVVPNTTPVNGDTNVSRQTETTDNR